MWYVCVFINLLIIYIYTYIYIYKVTYQGGNVWSTETDIDMGLAKAWTAIDSQSVIWKSDLTDKLKSSFFQAAFVSILLYGCTTWTLTKHMEKKLDGNYTRMLREILNQTWRLHPTKLYGNQPPITKTIEIRRTRHAGNCWRSRDEHIRDVLLWTHSHGRRKAGRLTRTYILQLCVDTGRSPEYQLEPMDDRKEWQERVRDLPADTVKWLYIYIYMCIYIYIVCVCI